jgi:hypothetical protein
MYACMNVCVIVLFVGMIRVEIKINVCMYVLYVYFTIIGVCMYV